MNITKVTCPMCSEGNLSPRNYSDTFTHNGRDLVVDNLESSVCDSCGAEPILTAQILSNQKLVADAKRIALGLLTGEQIKLIRDCLNLSQKQAALIVGGGVHAFSKYERGEVIQSEPMDKLLRLLFIDPTNITKLEREFPAFPRLVCYEYEKVGWRTIHSAIQRPRWSDVSVIANSYKETSVNDSRWVESSVA